MDDPPWRGEATPVSYTHLDVYKRQGLMVLMLLALIRNDLIRNWQASLPIDAPNRFVINIQPAQISGIKEFFTQQKIQDATILLSSDDGGKQSERREPRRFLPAAALPFFTAVSYTHLDVYKRQAKVRGIWLFFPVPY